MISFFSRQIRRFRHALRGFCVAYQIDTNFRLQAWLAVVFGVVGYFTWPLAQTEILFLALAYTLIVITELQNTSFETALDRLHPEHHEDIGASKDIAAASVLAAGLFALVVVMVIAISRI